MSFRWWAQAIALNLSPDGLELTVLGNPRGVTENLVLHELLELERAGWDSLCKQTGTDYYGAVMLPNAVMVPANGMVIDRDTVVSALSKSPPWRTYEIDDVRLVQVDNDNAAWCTAEPIIETATSPPSSGRCRACTTARRRGGNSRCISSPKSVMR
jgi:hypothetical protein